MSFSVARGSALLESLSTSDVALPPRLRRGFGGQVGPSRSETRQKHPPRRSLKREVKLFRKTVWSYWKKNGRHDLPWRSPSLKLRRTKEILDPYKILVSEVMLQQTQVERVIPYYKKFLKRFPTARALARASLADVLKEWSGLGYNRRAKFLRDAAIQVVETHRGSVPREYAALRALPGIGDYTAKAVRVFAFNLPDVLIETNIRAAFIHHFYSSILPARRSLGAGGQNTAIADVQILPLAHHAAGGQDPREWHWALMDYGTHIKKIHKNPARRSAHYVRQSKFEGSLRQVRGTILRALTHGQSMNDLRSRSYSLVRTNKRISEDKIQHALTSLARDKLIVQKVRKWHVA